MNKIVVIINGAGGSGKDTFIQACKAPLSFNISSVDEVKEIARRCGWDGGKTNKDRKFLSDLKAALAKYNALPMRYMTSQLQTFLKGSGNILFVHIREPEEIAAFKSVCQHLGAHVATLLVESSRTAEHTYGNHSDDDVASYDYDYVYHNDLPLEQAKIDMSAFFNDMLKKLEVAYE